MDISKRLKSAREQTGLTQLQVAKRCAIDDSSVSAFETGRSEPRLAQLAKLAEVYHVSLNYFFEEEEPQPQLVMWRNNPKDGKEIEAEFLQLCQQYRKLELWTNNANEGELPKMPRWPGRFWYPQVEEMASLTRSMMGLGQRPGESLYWVLEEVYGVKVFFLDLSSAGVAACAVSPDFGTAVLLDRKCRRWRRNHDLAHELFHLLTWEHFGHRDGLCEPTEQEEKFATCFAGNLLLPSEPVRLAISKAADDKGQLSFDQLDGIAREFDVSLKSILWRMHFLFNWEESQTKSYVDAAEVYIRTADREDKSEPPLLPRRYRALAIKAFRNGDTSLGRFSKLMRMSRREAEQYTTGREPDNAEVPIPNR